MTRDNQILFGSFRLDVVNQCLWRSDEAMPLAPKDFSVLHYLLLHPGRLVTKVELIEAVWPETTVTDGVLKVSIRKIRATLDDDSRSPQFIETAHRRGYRFIGRIKSPALGVEEDSTADTSGHLLQTAPTTPGSSFAGPHRQGTWLPVSGLVGREKALAKMQEWLRLAIGGERQVVFVTGEAGIGKTTLVEAFLQSVKDKSDVWIGQGQCLEQYGAGEAYLPVLEAVSRLCQEPSGAALMELLRRQAPTWLQQMPGLIDNVERENLQRDVIGATRERMLREMAEALETLTQATPLVLVLEDLHWSDYSTLDLVSYLARRRKPAQLFLVATYRPVEVTLRDHPLKGVKQELLAHRLCEELPLEYLGQDAIRQYLDVRFTQHQFPGEFAALLHGRTEGNPFFLINAVDYLQAEGLIAEHAGQWMLAAALSELEVGVPQSIRQMIERQIERLDRDQQRLLEVAAIAGSEFPAAAVAAGLEQDLMQIEEACEELERQQQFLHATGVSKLPDGTITARYGFIHALYQAVLYQRVAAGRRVRLHQLIGEYGERVYGARAGEIAAELAMHFEHGHDYKRAVKYLRQAANNHFLRYANREAVDYLNRATDFLDSWPEAERTDVRIAIIEQSGLARLAMGEMVAAAEDFRTLADYAREQGRTEDEATASDHLATALSWVDRERCLAAAERCLALSRQASDELLQARARGCWAYWQVLYVAWENEHAEALTEAVAAARRSGAMTGLLLARLSYVECLRSDYTAACRAAEEAAQLALEASDAHTLLLSQFFHAWALLHRGHWGEMRRHLCYGLEVAQRNKHERWRVLYQVELAWLHEQAFDLETARQMGEQAYEQARAIGPAYTESLSLIVLGKTYLGLGQGRKAFRCFSEVSNRLERGRSLMDWILQILLRDGLSRYWLAQEEFTRARQEAESLRELASKPGERTYLARAHRTLAEVELAMGRSDNAEIELSHALSALGRIEAPLAEWRVCGTAAALGQHLGDRKVAANHRRRRSEVLRRLAGSLEEGDSLRASMLADLANEANE